MASDKKEIMPSDKKEPKKEIKVKEKKVSADELKNISGALKSNEGTAEAQTPETGTASSLHSDVAGAA